MAFKYNYWTNNLEEQPIMPLPCVITGKWCDNDGDCYNCPIYNKQRKDE